MNDHSSIYTDTSCHFMLSYMGGLHKNWMFSVQTVILVWAVNILIVIMCLGSTLPLQKCTVKHYWKQALPSLWNVWYVLAPASDSPQSISWGPLEPLDIWSSRLKIYWKENISYVAFCKEHYLRLLYTYEWNKPQTWSPSQTNYETLPNYAITCFKKNKKK